MVHGGGGFGASPVVVDSVPSVTVVVDSLPTVVDSGGSRVREMEWSMTPWGGGFGAVVVDLVLIVVVGGHCFGSWNSGRSLLLERETERTETKSSQSERTDRLRAHVIDLGFIQQITLYLLTNSSVTHLTNMFKLF